MRTSLSQYPDWAGGVVTAPEADSLPMNASPHGKNTALVSAGPGLVAFMRRKGASVVNATAISGTPAVLGIYQWKYRATATFTSYTFLVSDGGRLDLLNSDGTLTTVDATAFTAGTSFPDFAAVGNRLVIVNGTDKKKVVYKGSSLTVQALGITAPTAPTIAVNAAAGNHNGTYEGRVVYVNGTTGEESSASAASATCSPVSQQIDWTVPVSSDTQVTARKLYLRNTATMTSFYLVTTISDNTTAAYTSNVADASLITPAPDTSENDPPPANLQLCEEFGGRLFVADAYRLYYSKIGKYEAFDPDNYETEITDDGQKMTGLLAHDGVLYVFKTNSIYAIVGSDPANWSVVKISKDIGAISHRTIFIQNGVIYFYSSFGPYRLKGLEQPTPIGIPILPSFSSDAVSINNLNIACGVGDVRNQRVQWAVPESGSTTRNTFMLPFSTRLGVWESHRWDPFDIASMGIVEDSSGIPQVYVGGYLGQVFKWWDGWYDGVSASYSGTVTGATANTLSDSTASFPTTGNGLKERYVYATDTAGTVQRRRITANTSTQVTVSANWTTTPNTTYTYIIGASQFELDTRWDDMNAPFHKKRYEFIFAQMASSTAASGGIIDLFADYTTDVAVKSFSFSVSATGGVWDTGLWDAAVWGGTTVTPLKKRVGKTGRQLRMRIKLSTPGQALAVYKCGVQSVAMTTKN